MDKKAMTEEIEWQKSLSHLIGKRVSLDYSQTQDWFTGSGTKRGWLREYEGRLILVARQNSNRFYWLTGGALDGFYGTLKVKKISEVTKKGEQ